MTSPVRFLYVTAPDAEEARKIARALIEKRLIACANLLPQMESIYRWDGEIQCENECLIIFKTTAERVPEAMNAIEKMHSYKTPCVIEIKLERGSEKYTNWLIDETKPD